MTPLVLEYDRDECVIYGCKQPASRYRTMALGREAAAEMGLCRNHARWTRPRDWPLNLDELVHVLEA